MNLSLRDWATPLVAGAFLLSAVTGILIFFHLDSGLNKAAHEWLGWVLVIGAAAHIVSNFPAFKKRLQYPLTKIIIGSFALILLLSFAPIGEGEGGGSPVRASLDGLTSAPLSVVAQVAQKDTDALMTALKEQGLTITADQSIRDVSGGDRETEMHALQVIFKK